MRLYNFIGLTVMAMAACDTVNVPKTEEKILPEMSINSVGNFEPVAVIELFTSQGCSSCPPADRLLAKTNKNNNGKNIFTLSFHVDYWNRLGWADPFSQNAFSRRQAQYVSSLRASGSYTPQMVVNGSTEFVGSNESSLNRAITRALNTKSEVSFTKLNTDSRDGAPLKVEYSLEGNYKGSTLNFALISLSETTVIKRGENGGVTLTNENVVRQFISTEAKSSGSVTFSASGKAAAGNLSVIAFVQTGNTGKVLGAARTKNL